MKRKPSLMLILAVVALTAAALACNLPGSGAAAPTSTPSPIPVSNEAVESIATQVIVAATQAASGGVITLEFTEEQLTSAAAMELEGQSQYSIRNVQVRLRDSLITITGDVEQSGFEMPLEIAMRVTPDAAGVPQADVVEASIGPLPLPGSITSEIESAFNGVIRTELANSGRNIVVDHITIDGGKMIIQAHTG